jgi:hypothetical protein
MGRQLPLPWTDPSLDWSEYYPATGGAGDVDPALDEAWAHDDNDADADEMRAFGRLQREGRP